MITKTALLVVVPLLLACGGRGVQREAVPSRAPAVAETVEFLRRASVFALHTGVDTVDGSTYQELAYNRLPGEEDGLWEQVLDDGTVLVWTLETLHLKVRKRVGDEGVKYALVPWYRGERLLRVEAGEALQLEVDGEVWSLEGTSGVAQPLPGAHQGAVEEWAVYPIDAEKLARLAAGQAVRLRWRGARGAVERRVAAHNRDLLRRFLAAATAPAAVAGQVTRISDLGGPSLMVYIDLGTAQGLGVDDELEIRTAAGHRVRARVRHVEADWAIVAVERPATGIGPGDAVGLAGP